MKKIILFCMMLFLLVLQGCGEEHFENESSLVNVNNDRNVADILDTIINSEIKTIESDVITPEVYLTIKYLENFWFDLVNVKIESLEYTKRYDDLQNDIICDFVLKGKKQTSGMDKNGSFEYLIKDTDGYIIDSAKIDVNFEGLRKDDKFIKNFTIKLKPGTYEIELVGIGDLNEHWQEDNNVHPIPVIVLH